MLEGSSVHTHVHQSCRARRYHACIGTLALLVMVGALVSPASADGGEGAAHPAVTGATPASSASYGTGGGYLTSLLADSGSAIDVGGTAGGLTASTDVAGSRATTWTVLLGPREG